MKKYPSYIESLVSELQSTEFANEILLRYKNYSSDPLLANLYLVFFECQSEFFYSSKALSLLNSAEDPSDHHFSLSETFTEKTGRESTCGVEEPTISLPIVQDSSVSTLWSECYMQKKHKTLKELSLVVKEFIESKGHCTYKEVADEIVAREPCGNEKNIKRRVYDAINVLTAANVFEKKGKQVCIVEEKCNMTKIVDKKVEELKKLARKYECLAGVIYRNKASPNYRQAVQLPFLVVLTHKNVRSI